MNDKIEGLWSAPHVILAMHSDTGAAIGAVFTL
jgi:hypothetical protein